MPATNKDTRLDFSSRAAKTAAQGFDFVRDLGAFASDYVDLFAAELTAGDYAGTALDGLDPADVLKLASCYQQIDTILSANDGEIRKAVKRLAQFNR